MTREEAFKIVEENLGNKNLIKHSLAVEAVMKAFGEYFNENSEKWALAGLLHDIDYEQTANDPQSHTLITAKILEEKEVDKEIIDIIKAHNHMFDIPRDSKARKLIISIDPITGLIVACALIHPNKKLASIDTQFVLNRFKEKSFAAGANREDIKKCEELDISLDKFVEISLKSMQNISQELGL